MAIPAMPMHQGMTFVPKHEMIVHPVPYQPKPQVPAGIKVPKVVPLPKKP